MHDSDHRAQPQAVYRNRRLSDEHARQRAGRGALRKQGYELTPRHARGRHDAVQHVQRPRTCRAQDLQSLGRLKYGKRSGPNQVIGVIGCMAQKDQELIFQRAPHVDIVVGTGQLAEIPATDRRGPRQPRKGAGRQPRPPRRHSRRKCRDSFQSYDPLRDPEMRPSPYQAFVRIMIGCDKFCTYCVVPMTRGPEQSRPPRDILHEVANSGGAGGQGSHAAGADGQQLQVHRGRPALAAVRPARRDSRHAGHRADQVRHELSRAT